MARYFSCDWRTWEKMPMPSPSPGTLVATPGSGPPRRVAVVIPARTAADGRGHCRPDSRYGDRDLDRFRSAATATGCSDTGVSSFLVVGCENRPATVSGSRSPISHSRWTCRSRRRNATERHRCTSVPIFCCGISDRDGSSGWALRCSIPVEPLFSRTPYTSMIGKVARSYRFCIRHSTTTVRGCIPAPVRLTSPISRFLRTDISNSAWDANELLTAVKAMKRRWPQLAEVSEEPRDFQLTHFNVNPEVYAPDGSRGRLGLAYIRVAILARTQT